MQKFIQNSRLPLLIAVFLIFYGYHFVANLRLGTPPDEIPHLSYVNDAMKSPILLPNYKSGKMIDSDGLNYLAHPPLYYSLLASAGLIFDLDPYADYKIFRLINLLMVGIGLFFILSAAVNLGVTGFSLLMLGASAFVVPNFLYIASSINNDNLSFMGMGCLFYSLSLFYLKARKDFIWAPIGVVLSFTILAFTKANVGLFAGSFLLFWILFSKFQFVKLFLKRSVIGVAVFCFSVLLLYYGLTFIEFGKFFPYPKYVYDLNPAASPMGFFEYFRRFFVLLISRFSVAYGHLSYEVYSGIFLNLFYFTIAAPLLFYCLARSWFFVRKNNLSVFFLFDSLFSATMVLIVIHLILGYQGYLQTGIVAAVQPRYYLFLVPVIWLPAFYLFSTYKKFQYIQFVISASIFVLFSNYLSAAPRMQTLSLKDMVEPAFFVSPNIEVDSYYHSELPLLGYKAGYIDKISFGDSIFILEGWSFDTKKTRTPKMIHVFFEGKPLARGVISFARPDVGYALKNLKANFSGFRIKHVNSSHLIRVCAIDVLAEFDDGSYSALQTASCD